MSSFAEYLIDVFAPWGEVRSRKMFGGLGLYRDSLMFALVADDIVYLKVDAASIGEFEAADLAPFTYTKNDKTYAMSYNRAPEAIFDDEEALIEWADRAYEAALRAKKK